MEDKYAKLLGLEFWLPDWFREEEEFIHVTLPAGTEFTVSLSLGITNLYGNKHWIVISIRK